MSAPKRSAVSRICLNRLVKEAKRCKEDPPPGCSAGPESQDNLFEWVATIEGPKDSPYENGLFFLKMSFNNDFPFKPPKVNFSTKIYHCNVNHENGYICLDILQDQWAPSLNVNKILISIQSLLDEPNPDDPLEQEIAKLYTTDRKLHDENARTWTLQYA